VYRSTRPRRRLGTRPDALGTHDDPLPTVPDRPPRGCGQPLERWYRRL
jgi:hypothetical protein